MVFTGGISLVGLSLGIPLVPPLEYPNPVVVMHGTLIGMPLGMWFGSEAVRYWCLRDL